MHIGDEIEELTRYRDWAPTALDCKGLGLEDRQDWYVVPCMRTRDSEALEESNFHVALETLGGESDTVEVHRFGHWGPGWFEVILAHPDHGKAVAEMKCALADYPVLNDTDFSEREYEEQSQAFLDFGASELAVAIADRFGLSERAQETLDTSDGAEVLLCVHGHFSHCGFEDSAESIAERLPDRRYVADLLRQVRRSERGLDVDWKALGWRKGGDDSMPRVTAL